ncbi:MAG: hypothetical protein ACMUHB_01180 [Thermoplasmatota archaeon]
MKWKPGGFKFWFYLIYRLFIVMALIFSIITGSFLNTGIAILTLVITFLPPIIERRLKFHYPSEFEIGIMIFIFLSLILGSIGKFYDIFPWWDLFLHTLSGILIGLVGFSLVYLLNRSRWKKIRLSRAFVAMFAFCFALSLGALWEIYEYGVDSLFGWNMQRSGLNDTMSDLMVDTLGAAFTAITGYIYLKGDVMVFQRIENWFVKKREKKIEKRAPNPVEAGFTTSGSD